jgi:RimJ/RimL family protein N-acetyltransferase
MSNRPPISSSRLILRAFRPTDAEDLHVYLSDACIYQFEPGEPISLEQAYKMAGELTSSPDFWAVELEETGRIIGQIYFKHTDPPHLQSWELGYIFSPHYQRQGYMTEAVGALVRQRFSDGDIHRIVAHCNPKNIPSWKLLEKVGFRREGLLLRNIYFRKNAQGEPLWTDTFVYALLKSDVNG